MLALHHLFERRGERAAAALFYEAARADQRAPAERFPALLWRHRVAKGRQGLGHRPLCESFAVDDYSVVVEDNEPPMRAAHLFDATSSRSCRPGSASTALPTGSGRMLSIWEQRMT